MGLGGLGLGGLLGRMVDWELWILGLDLSSVLARVLVCALWDLDVL